MTETTSQTCSYIAEKSDPENWHGEDPDDWQLETESWSCPHNIPDSLINEEANDQYCIFHTSPEKVPDEIDVGDAFVHAINEESSTSDEDTARQKKQFVGATFGSFVIKEDTNLNAGDEYPIRFNHSVFQEGISSQEMTFNHDILAGGAVFRGDGNVRFDGAKFCGDAGVRFDEAEFCGDAGVSFYGAEFGGEAHFSEAVFNDEVYFSEAVFNDEVYFSRAVFNDEVRCAAAKFNDNVGFRNAIFSGSAIFNLSKFKGSASFPAEFSSGVWFDEAEFCGDGQIDFGYAEFSGDDASVSFRKTKFNGLATFWGTTFRGDAEVIFNKAEFNGVSDVRFKDARFSGDGRVSFKNVKFNGDGLVLFEGAKFSGDDSVSFGGTTFRGNAKVSFTGAEFSCDGGVFFDRVEFINGGEVEFINADFHTSVNFQVKDFGSPSDVSYAHADFSDCDLKVDTMAKMNLEEVDFTGVNLSGVDFSDAHLELATFTRTVLYGTTFCGAKLDGASFGNAQVNESTDFFGDDADSAKPKSIFYDPRYHEVRETHLDQLKRAADRYLPRRPSWYYDPRSSSSIGDDDETEHWKAEYLQKAARTYHTLEKIGRENSLPDLQTTGFVGRQEMHRYRYAEKAATSTKGTLSYWGKWLRASIARLTLLYGESPWRVIGVAMLVILMSALLYPLGAFRASPNGPVFDAETIPAYISMLPDSLYFSTLTFTTLGFGDFQPHAWGRWLATTETALGATLMALLVFVLGRRAAR